MTETYRIDPFVFGASVGLVMSACLRCAAPIVQTNRAGGVSFGQRGNKRLYCTVRCKRDAQRDDPRMQELRRAWRRDHLAQTRDSKSRDARRAHAEGILHYGGRCSCCGEDEIKFLTIEHINGRKGETVRYTGKRAWTDLKRRGWPADITILCFNCNCARGAFGECPHVKTREGVMPL